MSHNLLKFPIYYDPRKFSGVMCLGVQIANNHNSCDRWYIPALPVALSNNEVVRMTSVLFSVQDPDLALELCMCHRENVSTQWFWFDRNLPAYPPQLQKYHSTLMICLKLLGQRTQFGFIIIWTLCPQFT